MSDMKVEVDKDKLQIRMSRDFDAPREKLWQAHTDAKAIEKWWGPRKYTTKVEKFDAKVGGEWKFINVDDKGNKHVFYGEFREVVKPQKITWTFNYEPYAGIVIEEMVTFEELPGGKTRLSTVSNYPSIEALEGMVQSGMEKGARETWDRLTELVERKE